MLRHSSSAWLLEQEARGLLSRLDRLEPFALHMPMVPAAAVSPAAQTEIENHLAKGRRELRARMREFLRWLEAPEGKRAPPAEAQRRYTFLRLRFNAVLSQFHIFADVLTQRSEHETGVWLSGLDVLAADALTLPRCYFSAPPVICYLDRSPGAAIRRVRTPLPGGGHNPVAVVRVPRERMVGSGLASSLVHEVGHQAAALLDLVPSIRSLLRQVQLSRPEKGKAWDLYSRWISEIVADFWAVARVGITATLGLMGVVSLPRVFVFRLNPDDPHPIPWIRVKLSCAMGNALYPHSQWERLSNLWESYYPRTGLDNELAKLLALLEATISDFVEAMIRHRPKSMGGKSLAEAMAIDERQPATLAVYYDSWRASPHLMRRALPSLVFAVLGQARADGKTTPEEESKTLSYMLTHWALQSTMKTATACAANPADRVCRTAPKLGDNYSQI